MAFQRLNERVVNRQQVEVMNFHVGLHKWNNGVVISVHKLAEAVPEDSLGRHPERRTGPP